MLLVGCGTIVGTPTNQVQRASFIGAGQMQDKRLGRWVVRVACAIGVGVAVLGGSVAANAGTVSTVGVGGLHVVPDQVGLGVKNAPVNTTDDLVWG